jgi:outer membrane immunogenic protein
MKRILVGGVALSVLGISLAAAADLPVAPVYKAPAAVPLYNWTGFYAGVNGGYSWGVTNTTITGAAPFTPNGNVFNPRPQGGFGGGQIGYNWQQPASNWVFGLETDFQATGEESTAICSAPTCVGPIAASPNAFVRTAIPYFGTFRGRVGWTPQSQWLLYVTGGLSYAEVRRRANQLGVYSEEDAQWRAGWTAGAGIEWAFANRWSAKVEYLYLDVGTNSVTIPTGGNAPFGPVTVSTRWTDNIFRAGINYRFW